MQSEPENTTKEIEKKPYQTPRLTKHGSIEQITGGGVDFDGDDAEMSMSGVEQ